MSECKCDEYYDKMQNLQRIVDSEMAFTDDIECLINPEGNCATLVCPNPEADTIDVQCCVDCCGDFTEYKVVRYYGRTWKAACHEAACVAREWRNEHK